MRRRGFTLLETILYLALLGVLSGVLSSFMVSALRREAKVGAILEAEENARFAIERIGAAVRNSKGASTPSAGGAGPSLTLTMADAAASPTVFAVTNGVLTMQKGTGPAVPLTSAGVSVTSVSFLNLLDPVADLRTEPVVVPCQSNQNKRLICHGGNTQCVSKNASLATGDALGPCFLTTSAKSTIKVSVSVSAGSALAGSDFRSSINLYDTFTVPRQN